jgi:hypothetical protein
VTRLPAGRPGVEYELDDVGEALRLYYKPLTQAVIMQKLESGGAQVMVHSIGPPDNVMARVWLDGDKDEGDDFFLDRECIGNFDSGGPWVKEHRNLEQLNEYLVLFGLKASLGKVGLEIEVVEPVDPSTE